MGQTDGRTDGSRYCLMPPPDGGGIKIIKRKPTKQRARVSVDNLCTPVSSAIKLHRVGTHLGLMHMHAVQSEVFGVVQVAHLHLGRRLTSATAAHLL